MNDETTKQAIELLIRVANGAILFRHDRDLDADICNFLAARGLGSREVRNKARDA